MKARIVQTLAVCLAAASQAVPAAEQDPTASRNLAASCFTCHGTDGNSVGGVPPSIAGRDRGELVQTLKDFKAGKRPATIMHQQAKGYTDEQLELIAAYFARQKTAPARAPSKAGS
jgi:cytochrome subunit of sulfide dehydrogenase